MESSRELRRFLKRVGRSAVHTDSARQFALLVDSVRDYAIYMLNVDGVITSWNVGAERIKGYAASEVVGEHFSKFYTEEDCVAGLPMRGLNSAVVNGKHEARGRRLRKDGTEFWADVVIQPIHEEDGRLTGFAKITRDITESCRSEERLHELAHFDQLTGLPNRVTSLAKLQDMITCGQAMSVIVADLVGLSAFNDTFGRAAGDQILKKTVERFEKAIGVDHWTGRLASDEFLVVLPGMIDGTELRSVCQRFIASFDTPVVGDGRQAFMAVNLGIAVHPIHGHSAAEILNNADLAVNQAKARGRNSFEIFNVEFRDLLEQRLICESALESALPNGEFELFYQPQVRLRDRRVLGAEALLRWRHPDRGFLGPDAFIEVLERSCHAHKVGGWILREACNFAARIRGLGLKTFSVSINLFDAQLRTGQLVDDVTTALREAGIPASALHLEITENIILGQSESIVTELHKLRKLGVGISFDDYGTGYASLSLLKGFPLSQLKIDRSFVQDLCGNQKDAAIVRAVAFLAREFQLDIVAEGIETAAQHDRLVGLGCEIGQGFLYSKAIAGDELMSAITKRLGNSSGKVRKIGFLR